MYGPYLPHLEWANFLQNQSVAPLFRAKQRLRKRSRHSRDPENTPHKFSGYSSCEALHELLSTRIPKLGCAEDGRFGPGCGSPRTSKPTTAASRRSPGVQTKETKEETRTTPKQPSVNQVTKCWYYGARFRFSTGFCEDAAVVDALGPGLTKSTGGLCQMSATDSRAVLITSGGSSAHF